MHFAAGRGLAVSAFLLLLLPPIAARAAEPEPLAPGAGLNRPAERRSGLLVGLTLGAGLAGSSGYPNDATKIGDPNYYSASGLMTGTGGTLLVMGALADYLNFGLWLGMATYANGDWQSKGGGGGLRVEWFPLYTLAPRLQDLAVFGQFGIGSTVLDGKVRPGVSADGAESFVGAGAFYEWSLAKLLGGHAALGPSLEYDAILSRPIERHSALLGLRLAFYGGP